MNTVRPKNVETNKVHLPLLRDVILPVLIMICSTIPVLIWFNCFLSVIDYIMAAIFAAPGIIAGGIIGNFAYDILKRKYGQIISDSKISQKYFRP